MVDLIDFEFDFDFALDKRVVKLCCCFLIVDSGKKNYFDYCYSSDEFVVLLHQVEFNQVRKKRIPFNTEIAEFNNLAFNVNKLYK